MVAILDTDNTLNLDVLDENLKKMLPAYARPLFVRIIEKVPLTGTYKLKKKDLQTDGFNINTVKDPIYFYDSRIKKFSLLTSALYNDICNGIIKL